MIKYSLICDKEHVFESWFSNSADCDKLLAKHAVDCPICGSIKVSKSIMAPSISKNRPSSDYQKTQNKEKEILDWVEKNCEDVGEKFATEVRAMHYGDKEERNIHGTASQEETQSLLKEGIDIIPIGHVKSKEH